MNIHQRVGPKKKSWHKLTEEQQPPTCSYQEYEDLAEVLMCEVELDNLHKEKSIKLLALESLVQHNVEVCTDKCCGLLVGDSLVLLFLLFLENPKSQIDKPAGSLDGAPIHRHFTNSKTKPCPEIVVSYSTTFAQLAFEAS